MSNQNETLWGIDLGGTKIEGVVLESAENPKVLARERIQTESEMGYRHVINQIGRLIVLLTKKTGFKPTGVGMGTPGTLEPGTGLMKNSNTTCLNGMPFQKDLEEQFQIQFKIANDANCFALAEAKFGAGKEINPDAEVVFGVILGTGVGGGVIAHDKIIGGMHGLGGEWGHNFLDESGGECYCGRVGCVETVISGPALEKYYKHHTGSQLSLKKINEKYEQGEDKRARETIERLHLFFGKAIANVINIIDPEIIILGGGVGNIGSIYTKGVAEVEKYVFNEEVKTHFVKPKLGDSAGVFGAAALMAKLNDIKIH
jgi:predicted NBD/HSP70 family sugar kinase